MLQKDISVLLIAAKKMFLDQLPSAAGLHLYNPSLLTSSPLLR